MHRAILERFREETGKLPIARMDTAAIQRILDKKSPSASRNWRKALSGLVKHAKTIGMMASNPLTDVTLARVKSTGHHTWTAEECEQFERHYPIGTRERLAFELLLQIGHSRSDVVRMGRQHVRDGVLSLTRQKTGVAFAVPIMPTLQRAIDAMLPSSHLMFLVTAQGRPFTAGGFGNWFREVCNAAGLPKRCTSHGLRKCAATRAADRGATTTQLKAWFGWKSADEAERYTQAADRKQAAAALAKLIAGSS
jgi:integrase